jgi:hypothetical protein
MTIVKGTAMALAQFKLAAHFQSLRILIVSILSAFVLAA